MQILCVAGMASMFAYFTGPLMQALSRPHELAVLGGDGPHWECFSYFWWEWLRGAVLTLKLWESLSPV